MEQMHVMNLLIAGGTSAVPTTGAGAYIDEYTDLADGELAVCNDQNCVLSAASVLTDGRVALTGIRLVGRYDTKLVYSDMIKHDDLISYRGIADVDDDLQVSFIGYVPGTGGAIEVINDNLYQVFIRLMQQSRTGFGRNETIDVAYKSAATATQMEIAFGLEELLRKSMNAQAEDAFIVRLVNSAALVNNDRVDHNVTVVQGSKYIVSAADWSTAGAVTVAAVGDLIRLGAAAAITGTGVAEQDAAVALGSTVYKVVSIPAADTIELDRPVTGISGTYTASTDVSVIPAASVGDFGIRIDAKAPTHVVGKRPFQRPSFTIGLTDCGTTAVTYTLGASLGHGNPEQIKDLEWFAHGQNGDRYRADAIAYQGYTTRVSNSTTYNQIAITWAPDSRTESIGGRGLNPKQLIIAFDVLYHNNDANDIVIDVLDAYAGALGFAASGIGV